MWTKSYRYCLVSSIYECIFRDFDAAVYPDWSLIISCLENTDKAEDKPLFNDLDESYKTFTQNYQAYKATLQLYLQDWDRTHLLVQSILLEFVQESEMLTNQKLELQIPELVSKYIRLTDNLIGGQGVSLVHAVLTKLIAAE